jgi:signal transduction histidine kinase
MKLRLAHKILIVLAVPVLFQLAFFGILTRMLHVLGENQDYERQSTDAIVLRDRLYVDFYQRVLLFAIYSATQDESYREKYEKVDDEINQDFERVKEVWGDDQEKLDALKALQRANRAISVMGYVRMNFAEQTNISNLLGGDMGMAMMRKALDANAGAEAELMLTRLQNEQADTESRLNATTRSVNLVLLFGSIISVIATIASSTFFSLSITERLKKVLLNIRAMEKGQRISEVSGKSADEISLLDKAVCETARQIRAAEEFQAQTTLLVAQELESPLNEIAAAFDELREHGFVDLNEKGADRLSHVTTEVNRLRTLVDDLLILDSVREAGFDLEIRSVDLSEIARSATDIVKELAASRKINIIVSGSAAPVQADPERMVQVVVNLLSNAIKFSPEGSSVEIRTESNGVQGRLSVIDHGPGIADEFRSRIFARFEQASQNSPPSASSGLGLAICKKLVEAQSGQMDFESEVGKGATFWLTVPVSVTATKGSGAPRDANRNWKPRLRQQTIALVALPLLVQLVAITVLSLVMNSVRDNLDELARTRTVVQIHTDIVKEVVRSTFFALIFNVTHAPQDKRVATSEQEQLRSLTDQLTAAVGNDPELKKDAQEMDVMVKRIQAMQLEMMAAKQDADIKRWFGPSNAAKNEKLLTQTMVPVENAIAHQYNLLESRSTSRRGVTVALEIVMVLSALLSTAVSIGLGLFMVRRLARKVDLLVSNTVRLQNRQPLPPPMEGDDGLAFVDHALHHAGTKLIELEQFKQEMVSVTSHELRTPLTSLLAFAELVSNGVFGTLSERGEKVLRHARRNTSELISMITNLLDSEKMQSGKVLVKRGSINVAEVINDAAASVADFDVALQTSTNASSMNGDSERLAQALRAILYDVVVRVPEKSAIKLDQIKTGTRNQLRITAPKFETEGHEARTRLSVGLSEMIAQQHGGKFEIESTSETQIYTFDLPS